mmetsp:Transcript_45286/g.80382  ORF Transcript_45286/g.80382 Transcript_45286/m.80382 type:complete len:397 (+) Transcript_45286:1-1191(+)
MPSMAQAQAALGRLHLYGLLALRYTQSASVMPSPPVSRGPVIISLDDDESRPTGYLAPTGYTALAQATSTVNQLEEANCDESLIAAAPSAASRAPRAGKRNMPRVYRYAVTLLLVMVMLGVAYDRLWYMAAHVGSPPSVEDLRGATQLYHTVEGPYDVNPNCKNSGDVGICICGTFGHCKHWEFKIGDVLIFEPAYVNNPMQWLEATVAACLFFSDAMHVAIVTDIYDNTPEGIMLSEALKPPMGIVKKNNLRVILHRWPLSGFWIKRPDPARFSINPVAIKTWSDSVQGQPFDMQMIVPFFRRVITHGRFIKQIPDDHEKKRALALYEAGGPGKWICTQLAAWLLAFPGGMNSLAAWPITNLQGTPAEVLRFNIWDPEGWHIKCYSAGCFIAIPE